FRAGVSEAYGAAADEIYAAYLALFEVSNALLRTANRVILSHSLAPARHLVGFDMDKVRRDALGPEDVALGGWLHALVWGRDTRATNARAFLDKVDGDWLISGHIPCEQGYGVPNEYQIILDALGAPACCCVFPTDGPMTQARLLEGVRVL